MPQTVTPMIHVSDVRATKDWYESIGFVLTGANEVDGEMDWARLSYGNSDVMFSEGGRPSTHDRREVDLYIQTEDLDDLYLRLRDRVEIREELHETFYGMKEFIIRDLNGFWITFGQPIRQEQAR
jgi:uncharacterized glyoxalase superfamily protein PhnB